MTGAVAIDAALADRNLLGASFDPSASWRTWLAVLKATFATPLDETEQEAFATVSGARKAPAERVRELWAIIGRRGGKSRVAAALAAFMATCVDHRDRLAPGEIGMVLVLAASRSQAGVVFAYICGLIENSPILMQQIEAVNADEIRLKDNIVIAVHANSFRTVRGRTLLCCIFDEIAFWRDETTANPDVETYRAVLPALATTGGLLVGISSPYRRRGLLHDKHRDAFGRDDADVLVVQGSSSLFNPTLDSGVIDRARQSDPEAARAEWDAEFRSDLSAFLDDDLIEVAIDHDRPLELPPRSDVSYSAFVDASAGRHDAFCVGIAHREGERIVADVIRGRHPPFDPASVAGEYAALAKSYRCSECTGDNYAGEWVASAFREAGIGYRRAEHPKSVLYLEGLPAFTRGLVSIPDHAGLCRELRLLERRVSRIGRDTVDHPIRGADDHANVLFGAISLVIADFPLEAFAKAFAGNIEVPTSDKPAALPWHRSEKDRRPIEVAPEGDLMVVYRETRARMEQGMPIERSKVCARCGGLIAGTRVHDGTQAWHPECHL
jgi:hypothetical protein